MIDVTNFEQMNGMIRGLELPIDIEEVFRSIENDSTEPEITAEDYRPEEE